MRSSPALFVVALLAAAFTCSCQRPSEAPQAAVESRPGPPPRASIVPAAAAPESLSAHRHPAASRVVAIGDLHGDLGSTRAALRLAGAIDGADHWIGKTMTVVQTGDQLDRGDDEPEILDLLERLEAEASAAGGRMLVLNGNHEIMNVEGDLRYVTPEGMTDFAHRKGDRPDSTSRAALFAPGTKLAERLARRPLVAIVGGTLFAHGGVLPAHVTYGLDRLSDETSRWMRGALPRPPAAVTAEDSPVWTRAWGDPSPSPDACKALDDVLTRLSVKRLVVGHTVQRTINAACDGKVYRIDVGLSDYYGKERRTEVLEIVGDDVRPLRE